MSDINIDSSIVKNLAANAACFKSSISNSSIESAPLSWGTGRSVHAPKNDLIMYMLLVVFVVCYKIQTWDAKPAPKTFYKNIVP